MRVCPIGGIATLNELQVIAGALDLACEYVSMIIQSETPDFRVRTAEDRKLLKDRQASLRTYRATLATVERVRKARRAA